MKKNITYHGYTGTHTFFCWYNMRNRCSNKKNSSYINYGGRGIKVCKRWYKFANFLEDMGEKPNGLSLDRIDNNGNYCKENCRWATMVEQNNNTRVCKHIDWKKAQEMRDDGETFREIAEMFNVSKQRIQQGLSTQYAIDN